MKFIAKRTLVFAIALAPLLNAYAAWPKILQCLVDAMSSSKKAHEDPASDSTPAKPTAALAPVAGTTSRSPNLAASLESAKKSGVVALSPLTVLSDYRKQHESSDPWNPQLTPEDHARQLDAAVADAERDVMSAPKIKADERQRVIEQLRRVAEDEKQNYRRRYDTSTEALRENAVDRSSREEGRVTDGGLTAWNYVIALSSYVSLQAERRGLDHMLYDPVSDLNWGAISKQWQFEYDHLKAKGQLPEGVKTFNDYFRKKAKVRTEEMLGKALGDEEFKMEDDWLAKAKEHDAQVQARTEAELDRRVRDYYTDPQRLALLEKFNRAQTPDEAQAIFQEITTHSADSLPKRGEPFYDDMIFPHNDLFANLQAAVYLFKTHGARGKIDIEDEARSRFMLDVSTLPRSDPYLGQARKMAEENQLQVQYDIGIRGDEAGFTINETRGSFSSDTRTLTITKHGVLDPEQGQRILKHENIHVEHDNKLRAGEVPALAGSLSTPGKENVMYGVRYLEEVLGFHHEAKNVKDPADPHVIRSNEYRAENMNYAGYFVNDTEFIMTVPDHTVSTKPQHPKILYVSVPVRDKVFTFAVKKDEFERASSERKREILRARANEILLASMDVISGS